ncbi:hypothetical protein ACFV6D_22120 [Kitasatospora sp. NPDC059812]|uniref:hypothetical protein n=1 Tax=Kitasatospora sp. NPDC059812 TaxID=3346958 RepID=UPI0036678CCC
MTTDMNEALAGLDAIDWTALHHAYGAAGDVPGQLRGLTAEDAGERKKALHHLYGNIFHQGSRYQASAVAVPFLAALAANAALPGRVEVLGLLASLAIGYDETHLPGGVDVIGWREDVEKFRVKDPAQIAVEYDEWVSQARDEVERRVREMGRAMFDFEGQLQAADAEIATYDAVRQELLTSALQGGGGRSRKSPAPVGKPSRMSGWYLTRLRTGVTSRSGAMLVRFARLCLT